MFGQYNNKSITLCRFENHAFLIIVESRRLYQLLCREISLFIIIHVSDREKQA